MQEHKSTSSGTKFDVLTSPFEIQSMQHYSTKILNMKRGNKWQEDPGVDEKINVTSESWNAV
jgi:hypothetical protein